MGERGFPAQPDNVRQLKGMPPLKDAAGRAAKRIVLPPKAPAAPPGMGAGALAEWRRVVPELEKAGVLSTVDRGALVAYCTAYAHMMEAQRTLAKEGAVIKSKRADTNGPVKHPAWQVYREANRTMLMAAAQLFITPVARLRFPVAAGAAPIGGAGDGRDDFD